MVFTHPEYLISPEALNAKLGNEDLRVFDATIHMVPNPEGGNLPESGRKTYDDAHVPGAAFLNQEIQLSDANSGLSFTRLGDNELIQAFADAGICAESDVVLYSSGKTMWATRAWWLLYYCGHKRIALLNGGLKAWQRAGFECSNQATTYVPACWNSSALPQLFARKDDVLKAVDSIAICTVSALSADVYSGTADHHYGRRGHIPNSINVFYDTLLDEGCYRSADEVQTSLLEAGLLDDRNVITYCGGGVSATVIAFACLLFGKDNVAVYDGSMDEWAKDESLPLLVGSLP